MADHGNGFYGQALGMIETKGWVALVEATDAMTKAAGQIGANASSPVKLKEPND